MCEPSPLLSPLISVKIVLMLFAQVDLGRDEEVERMLAGNFNNHYFCLYYLGLCVYYVSGGREGGGGGGNRGRRLGGGEKRSKRKKRIYI